MAFKFNDAFNKFVDLNNKLNHQVNEKIGKDIFPDARKIEEPKEFPPYESVTSAYDVPEPEQWPAYKGTAKQFSICGNIISVSAELDTCIQYRKHFKTLAEYYTNQFKFKYNQCVNDFDSFMNYFVDIYVEGMIPMAKRAHSLLLPFGVYDEGFEEFLAKHTTHHNKAEKSYITMGGIEETKNAAAENVGNTIGNSIQLRGGGFGLKGAAKGIATARAFNFGMKAIGKFVASQNKMTQEEKTEVFEKFNQELFFKEVYQDYFNVYLTLVQTLCDKRVIKGVTTYVTEDLKTKLKNLKNPMFPQEKIVPTLCEMISLNPFVGDTFVMLQEKLGNTQEVVEIINYSFS